MPQVTSVRKLTRRKMRRKQIYLLPQQDTRLKELAHKQLTTEAELIRQAVEAYLNQPMSGLKHLPPDQAAWQEILASFEEVRKQSVAGEPHRWTRADYYDDPRSQRDWAA